MDGAESIQTVVGKASVKAASRPQVTPDREGPTE
jgi:hypothetical protein